MRLEEYWGIGPKTSELLTEELGVETAREAIESSDIGTLVDAGLPRGRATRILRYAHGGEAMNLLATPDSRDVYKELLSIIGEYAVTSGTADRLQILTPLATQEAMESQLVEVTEARNEWETLTEDERATVLAAFSTYEEIEQRTRAAVVAALELKRANLDSGLFDALAPLAVDTLKDASAALAGLSGEGETIGPGADERLDTLREQLGAVEDMAATPEAVVEEIRSGARGATDLQELLVREVTTETGIEGAAVREVLPESAADAQGFVTETLRALVEDRREAVAEREETVTAELEAVLEETESAVETVVEVVEESAFVISLARFASDFELVAPTYVDDQVIAVEQATNLFLEVGNTEVQKVTYAVGDHNLSLAEATAPPRDHRVAVLTGANSGGKTTLLETLCQVQLLAQMGLPVPAKQAEVGTVDTIVFHRRHASFNAGVLESTLRSVVPPVTDTGKTLMLVDEFEAITEPGSAANLLHGLVNLTVERDALGVFVTHLADDLEPLPAQARTDGIFAEGLTPSLELEVDYQPRFETVGRSTPEFIVSRLVANATDRGERAGYEVLAEAVGERAVQRTLADARWTE